MTSKRKNLLNKEEDSLVDNEKETAQIVGKSLPTRYPLSEGQKGLWVIQATDSGSTIYNLPFVLDLDNSIDTNIIYEAAEKLLEAHPILRVIFGIESTTEELYQEVQDVRDCLKMDIGDLNEGEEIRSVFKQLIHQPFDLSKEVVRLHVRKDIEKKKTYLLFLAHHIVVDGISGVLIENEYKQLLNKLISGAEIGPINEDRTYFDFIDWEIAHVGSKEGAEALAYWQNQWQDEMKKLELPYDAIPKKPEGEREKEGVKTFSLKGDELAALKAAAKTQKVNLSVFLLTAFKVLLYRLSGANDVIVKMDTAGRPAEKYERSIGYFVNSMLSRTSLSGDMSFEDLTNTLRSEFISSIDHLDYPYPRLLTELKLTKSERDSVFAVAFNYLNIFDEALETSSESELVFKDRSDQGFGDEYALEILDLRTELNIQLKYLTDLFLPATVQRHLEYYKRILTEVVTNPQIQISDIALLSETEKNQLLYDFNDTKVDFPAEKTMVDLFEEQVEKTPDNIAVVYEDSELTYRELNEKANEVGHYLISNYEIQPDDIVAIQMERSEWMIIAILGIMKAGAAYLPIDPDYPENRVTYMLENSQAKLLLSDGVTFLSSMMIYGSLLPVLPVDAATEGESENPKVFLKDNHLAYVIYTSGSTGRPKGVAIQHSNIVNYVNWVQNFIVQKKKVGNTVLGQSIAFDLGLTGFYGALLSGHVVHLPKNDLDFAEILEYIFNPTTNADWVKLTPSHISLLGEMSITKTNIKLIVCGGEQLTPHHIAIIKEISPEIEVINHYGPTETTVGCIAGEVGDNEGKISIGKPISNNQVYILDKQYNILPIGVVGEIMVSGVGVSRGYLNKPDLTKERFIANPFISGKRLYKTGDLACWLPEGCIDFKGRMDDQVKIRGYRVETGEIEQNMLKHRDIQSCVVICKEFAEGSELVAYIVSNQTAVPDIQTLRNFLSESLPDYMIPAHFVELEALPLTNNGKVDRKALPEPDGLGIATGITYVAPHTQMEILLADVWKDVLRQPSISVHDNFFHIGGDSIKAIQISGRMGAQGLSLSVGDLFEYPSIAALAPKITEKKQIYPQGLAHGNVLLTAIQNWFFGEVLIDPHHFNQAISLSSQEQLDEVALKQSLNALLEQHDLLRATYEIKDGLPIQKISDTVDLDFQVIPVKKEDNEADEIARLSLEAQTGYNLEKGPLFKAILFQKEEGDELLLVVHHLVVDGVSWRIIVEDLTQAYSQLLDRKTIELAPKTAPFSWWAEEIQTYAKGNEAMEQYNYWEQVLAQPISKIEVDHPNQPNLVGDSTSVCFQLSKEHTEALLKHTNQAYNTEINDVLLTSLSRALKQAFGGEAYQVTLEGHGREEIIDMDISRTVGWFTSKFPVVLDYIESTEFHLLTIKEMLHRIPDKGIVYGLLKYLNEQEFTKKDEGAINFNYLGAFSQGDTDALFQLSGRDVGATVSPASHRQNELDVLGIHTGEELEISIDYSSQRIEKARMESLISAFENALLEIIGHCTAQEETRSTPCDFTSCDLSLEAYQNFLSSNNLTAEEIDDIYSLSPLQEGLLFHKLLDSDSAAYFRQLDLSLSGKLDEKLFHQCWQLVLDCHPVLRTSFYSVGLDRPLQLVRNRVEVAFTIQDISDLDIDGQEAYIESYIKNDVAKGIDLKEKSLARFVLIKIGQEDYRFIMTNHHIILDGWSLPLLFKDFLDFYEKGGKLGSVQPKLFSPFITWLEKQTETERESFWKDYLSDFEGLSGIPGLRTSSKSEVNETAEEVIKLSKEQTTALSELGRSSGVSLNTVVQGVWAVILGAYNQTEDVVFGMTSSGRSAQVEGIEEMTGLFINTVPIRIDLRPNEPFSSLLTQIQQSALAVREYEHYTLPNIQSLWEGKGDLFDHILVFENYPLEEVISKVETSLNIAVVEGYGAVHYNFRIKILPGAEMEIRLLYNIEGLSHQQVERTKSHFESAIENLISKPEQLTSELGILPETERQLILQDFNETKVDFPDKTIIDIFEQQVKKTPENIAVVFGEIELTYHELNEKANQVAHHLLDNYDVQPDDIIAIQLDRSEWMIIAILGIMKAGGAYLPIDIDYPEKRVEYMLENSQAKVLITDEVTFFTAMTIYGSLLPVLIMDAMTEEPVDNPGNSINGQNLAYVIYTSGSTGQPKGVMIEHSSISNYIQWANTKYFNNSSKQSMALITSITFDMALTTLFSPLLRGSQLHIYASNEIDDLLRNVFVENKEIKSVKLTPGHIDLLAGLGLTKTHVQSVILGGEALKTNQVDFLLGLNKDLIIYNEYGPTEATVGCSVQELNYNYSEITVGEPIANTDLYIVNKKNQIQGINVPGELCIGGSGLARGYLNNPELTAEKFIPHLFNPTGRLYKTGDLASWLPNGQIEFLGRIDHQLKIRGYRIEAGEIEQALLQHSNINSCVLVGKEFGNSKELVAYIVCNTDTIPDVSTLRSFLSESLPEYMVPAYFVELEKLPLSKNGKVNRKALPDPDGLEITSGVAYVAPRDEIEQTLVNICEEILQKENIGIDDNFFDLGGHSLRVIRLVSLIQQELEVEIKLTQVFDYPTISLLAEKVKDARQVQLLQCVSISDEEKEQVDDQTTEEIW